MVYLNLLYRQKAELEATNEARQGDLRIAEEWADKPLETRRVRNAQPSQQENPQK